MAKAGSNEVSFEILVSDGGAASTGFASNYITKINDVVVNREAVDATPFGVVDETYIIGVMKKRDPLVISGFYDDTATTGPDAVLNIGKITHTAPRSCTLTLKSGKTITGTVWIEKYTRTLEVGNYHGYEASLRYTGTVTEV
jgi:hypothetical protein